MRRVHNFSAGPAALPLAVLEQAKADLPDYHGIGSTILEVSHRGPVFDNVIEQAKADLRELLGLDEQFEVLFLQGGAQTQFVHVPINLAARKPGGYVVTGYWSNLAEREAAKLASTHIIASTKTDGFTHIPAFDTWTMEQELAYVHIATNETIDGVEFHELPDLPADLPLIGDMSSTLLSRPIDVNKYGLIYAGAQKNIGPAGLTLVLVKRELLKRCDSKLPNMFSYAIQAAKDSMYNTPPTFSIYLAGLVFKWLLTQGGLTAMAQINQRKAQNLYKCIDASSLYNNSVAISARSWMNVPFTLIDPNLNERFLEQALARDLVGLKGHKSIGGMRASLYNAVAPESVDALIAFMQEFEHKA